MANDKDLVRSVKEIKRDLIRRAIAGESRYSGPEMIALILRHGRQGRDLPEDHLQELGQIDDNQARAVRALNLLAKEMGISERYVDLSGMQPPTETIN